MEVSRSMIMAVALLVALVVGSWTVGEAAISCSTVSGDLGPCVGYATGGAGPSQQCCNGVRSLYAATKASRPDRVQACNCIKQLVGALGSKVKGAAVSGLPGKCGVNLGYSITTSTNCAGIP